MYLGLDSSFFDKGTAFQQRIHSKPKLRPPSSDEIVALKLVKGELIKKQGDISSSHYEWLFPKRQ
jgi:hypothetical protein